MVIGSAKDQSVVSVIKQFDAFCRTIAFTNLPLNMGPVRPQSEEL